MSRVAMMIRVATTGPRATMMQMASGLRMKMVLGCGSALLGVVGATGVASAQEPPAEAAAAESSERSQAKAAPAAGHEPRKHRRVIEDTSWRRRVRERQQAERDYGDWTHFYFELRFGPYYPRVDQEPGLSGSPYEEFFGDDPLFYFGLEADWLPLYIPYVLSLGPGIGWGYTAASAKTKVTGSGEEAGSDTSLTIMPMHLSAVARFDGPLRELSIPVVPYLKAGVGWGVWDASGPGDDSGAGDELGEGSSVGLHLAIGGALALNAFDPSAAKAMRDEVGIRYAYIYGEWMYDDLGGFGSRPQLHVGTSTAVFGLALDL